MSSLMSPPGGGPGAPRAGRLRYTHVARPAALAAVTLVVAVLADPVLAGVLLPGLLGRHWIWPRLAGGWLAAATSALAHPGHPALGWAAPERPAVPGTGAFWATFCLLLCAQAVVAASVVARWPGQGASRAVRRSRLRPALHLCEALSAVLGHPLPDGRDRHGLASASQLRREASVAAARRRAPQTRPALAARRRPLAREEVGYPLGMARRGRVPLWPSWEASLRLVAPPGEGKTFRALAPVLRQHPGPAIATSTKSDLYELTVAARERHGPVVALDPDGLVPAAPRARWSPVSGCEETVVAERRAAALVAAAGDDGDAQNGAFFRDSARDLLKVYLHAAALEGLDIRSVLAWSRRPDDLTPAEVLATSPFAAPGWSDLIDLHTSGATETTSGVLRYVGRALSCFSHEAVVEACCPAPGDELDIAQLLASRGTLYLLGKGSRLGAVAPLLTALADETFECAERLAACMPSRRLDPPLLGLLDEAPSIAPIPSLPDLLADGRGRGIVLVYAMQSFSQAVSRWGAPRAETMANATTITVVLGGLTSADDLANLERLCGQRRVRRVSVHHNSPGGHGRDQSRTIGWESEAVLRADQIRTLPAGTGLVLWSRLPPVLARLPLMSERPDWRAVRQEEAVARQANDRARARRAFIDRPTPITSPRHIPPLPQEA